MDAEQYLAAIARDAELLVDAAERAGLDAPVPSCPDWTVSDLLGHVGQVHRWALKNTARASEAPSSGFGDLPEPPDAAARPQWVREGAREVVAALDRPSDDPAWNFGSPSTVGFWQRRQAHEIAMHRVDAELAAGQAVTPIDGALAADGIDERLERLSLPRLRPMTGSGETVHLHCTDVPGEWLITLAPDGLEILSQHAKGDVAARGSASDLLCWSYGRSSDDALEVFGDRELLERFRETSKPERRNP